MSAEIARVEFTTEQTALIKRTICQGATDDELTLFLAQCKRTGLDPFARQIHAVKRFDKKQNREVMSIQIGIDGFRLIGDRTGLYDGQEGPFWCGKDGIWKDVWISADYPMAAKVLVYRKGCNRPFTGIAHWDEYAQTYKDGNPLPMWAQMPAGQLAKCAESLALRKAFPQELSGLYAPEELSEPTEAGESRRVKETRPVQAQAEQKHDPKALAEKFATCIRAATSLSELEGLVKHMNADVEAKLLNKAATDVLIPLVRERKTQLAAQPETFPLNAGDADVEGEESADPTPQDTTSSSTTSPDPAAKPMPAAERRTEPPKAATLPGTDVLMAGGNIVRVLIELMHKLDVNWAQIRDGTGKGGEIALSCGLAKMPADFKINQLTAAEAMRLKTELDIRVAEKDKRAKQREASAARKNTEGAPA